MEATPPRFFRIPIRVTETQITSGPGGRILTNCHVWSPDGEWIVYDTRSDPAGSNFDGTRIEAVHVRTREVRTLYESRNGANCGVATWHPRLPRVAFILGPEQSALSPSPLRGEGWSGGEVSTPQATPTLTLPPPRGREPDTSTCFITCPGQ